jgi:hypothetical protein
MAKSKKPDPKKHVLALLFREAVYLLIKFWADYYG